MSLQEKTSKALVWTFSERFGLQVMQFAVSVVLARQLSPSDFGLLGMLSVFIVLGQHLISGGFAQALIQKAESNDEDATSVFYFGLVTSIVLIVLLYFLSPAVADFYNEPRLVWLTRVVSLNLLFGALMNVNNTLLMKRMQFRKKVISNFIAYPISACVGIWMAFNNYGFWSLVGMSLSASFFRMLSIWVLFPWRPQARLNLHSLKEMFPYGSKMLLSGIISIIFDNIYMILIGKKYRAEELGYYSRANHIHTLIPVLLSQTIGQVMFPAFSVVQNDNERFLRGVRKAISLSLFFLIPILLGMSAISDIFIAVIYGSKWLPTVPYLRILCISGLFYPLRYINNSILKAKGRSDLYLIQEVIFRLLQVLNILVTYKYGIVTLLIGNTICCAIGWIISASFAQITLKYNILMQMRDIRVSLMLGVGMVISQIGLRYATTGSATLITLIVQVLLGICVYLSGVLIVKPQAYYDTRDFISSIFKKT